jgi:MFS family permease
VVYTSLFASCRFAQGAALAIMDVAIVVYCTKLFPGQVSEVVGENQAVNGLGVMLGPPLGGFLFKIGGFSLPLLLTGGVCAAICLATFVIVECHSELRELHQYSTLPRSLLPANSNLAASFGSSDLEPSEEEVGVTSRHIRRVLGLPAALCVGPVLANGLGVACFGFCESLGPLFLYNRYGIEAWGFGLLMAAVALVYAVVAVAVGRLVGGANAWRRPIAITAGLLLLSTSMFLSGPAFAAAGLPRVAHAEACSISGILLLGAAMAVIQVTAVATLVDAAKALDKRLVTAASAFANFGMSVGGFVGPTAGSHLAEHLGFDRSFFVLSVLAVVAGVAFLTCVFVTLKDPAFVQQQQQQQHLTVPSRERSPRHASLNRNDAGSSEGIYDVSAATSDGIFSFSKPSGVDLNRDKT